MDDDSFIRTNNANYRSRTALANRIFTFYGTQEESGLAKV